MKITSVNDILNLPNWQAHYTAIVEPDGLGRRWFMGFKRKNAKRSRKGRVVWLCRPPINLDETTAAYEKLKRQAIAQEATDRAPA